MPTVTTPFEAKLAKIFRRLVAKRWWIIAIYALLVPPAAYLATTVAQDNSLDRLVVQTDPTYIANKQFEKVFGHGEYVLVLVEAPDPYDPKVLRRFGEMEAAVAKVPKVSSTSSALTIYSRVRAGFDYSAESAAAFKKFITGTQLFKRQGLVGEHLLALPTILEVKTTEE